MNASALSRTIPLWTRARRLGAVAGTLARAARLLLAPIDHAQVSGRGPDRGQPRRSALGVGVGVDAAAAQAAPGLERLLELTLMLREGYESQCRHLSGPDFGELGSTCREHGRRQNDLGRRLTARLLALGSPVEPIAPSWSNAASGDAVELPDGELGRLLGVHRTILREAKSVGGRRAGAAWTTQQEIVVADVVATNRRQAATLLRLLVERRGVKPTPRE